MFYRTITLVACLFPTYQRTMHLSQQVCSSPTRPEGSCEHDEHHAQPNDDCPRGARDRFLAPRNPVTAPAQGRRGMGEGRDHEASPSLIGTGRGSSLPRTCSPLAAATPEFREGPGGGSGQSE